MVSPRTASSMTSRSAAGPRAPSPSPPSAPQPSPPRSIPDAPSRRRPVDGSTGAPGRHARVDRAVAADAASARSGSITSWGADTIRHSSHDRRQCRSDRRRSTRWPSAWAAPSTVGGLCHDRAMAGPGRAPRRRSPAVMVPAPTSDPHPDAQVAPLTANRLTTTLCWPRPSADARAGLAEGGIPIGAAWSSTARCRHRSQPSGSSWAARSGTARPTAWRTPGGCRRRSTPGRPWSPRCRRATCAPARSCCTASHGWSSARTRTFYGGEDYLRSRGVEVVVLQDADCIAMMTRLHPGQP